MEIGHSTVFSSFSCLHIVSPRSFWELIAIYKYFYHAPSLDIPPVWVDIGTVSGFSVQKTVFAHQAWNWSRSLLSWGDDLKWEMMNRVFRWNCTVLQSVVELLNYSRESCDHFHILSQRNKPDDWRSFIRCRHESINWTLVAAMWRKGCCSIRSCWFGQRITTIWNNSGRSITCQWSMLLSNWQCSWWIGCRMECDCWSRVWKRDHWEYNPKWSFHYNQWTRRVYVVSFHIDGISNHSILFLWIVHTHTFNVIRISVWITFSIICVLYVALRIYFSNRMIRKRVIEKVDRRVALIPSSIYSQYVSSYPSINN